jgi:hypothetical protein
LSTLVRQRSLPPESFPSQETSNPLWPHNSNNNNNNNKPTQERNKEITKEMQKIPQKSKKKKKIKSIFYFSIAVSSLGKLGRFGNQVFQYSFCRFASDLVSVPLSVPDWVGRHLFTSGKEDLLLEKGPTGLPIARERDASLANSTFTEEVIGEIERASNGQPPSYVGPESFASREEVEATMVGRDVWGWFQHSCAAMHPTERERAAFRALFRPVPELQEAMDRAWAKLSGDGSRTVVGVHIRRGDYTTIAMTSFGYSVPTEWYLGWLDAVWPTLTNPVLFVATDDMTGEVVKDFARYNPETLVTLGVGMPESMASLKAGFYPDWYLLSMCPLLAISNSTFSYSAAMMNEVEGAVMVRPHAERGLIPFNPWLEAPILHREISSSPAKVVLDTLGLVYRTEGLLACLRTLSIDLPRHFIRSAAVALALKRDQAPPPQQPPQASPSSPAMPAKPQPATGRDMKKMAAPLAPRRQTNDLPHGSHRRPTLDKHK